MRLEDYVRKAYESGMYPDAGSDIEAYMRIRLARRRAPGRRFRIAVGRWHMART